MGGFQQPDWLAWLWLLPLLAGLWAYAGWRRRQDLARLADRGLGGRLAAQLQPGRRRLKAALGLLAAAAIIVALARPAWNPITEKVRARGRDVVFVLDVSRSMLAEDLAPNRLERAKLAIADCLEKVEGDRVALIVFAGTAVVRCPLTLDYGFFRLMLEDVSPDSVSRGGTLIGDALRLCLDQVFDERPGHKDVILITDGDDQESFPVEAAKTLGARGARLLAVGIGDERQGRPIPLTDARGRKHNLQYQGHDVLVKLNAQTLRAMVEATPGGRYLNVATGTFDLGEIYRQLVAAAAKQELDDRQIRRFEEKFQIFAALAFGLLALEMLIGEKRSG